MRIKNNATIIIALLIFSCNFLLIQKRNVECQDPFFTLVAKTFDTEIIPYFEIIKQQMKRIHINLEIILQDGVYESLLAFPDFDITIFPFYDFSLETFLREVYTENGTWNISGYSTTLDWEEGLGTGRNEYLLQEFNSIVPPGSIDRRNLCYEWQYYLLDKILPCYPLYINEDYMIYWNNLKGFDYRDGLLQSWGKLSWEGVHEGQVNTYEIVIVDDSWTNLNPIYFSSSLNSPDRYLANFIMEPLVWRDSDYSYWPHLASDWMHLNESHVRLTIREGIKWQNDTEEKFTDEYLDADDVYFTFYVNEMFGKLSYIEEFKKINSTTIDVILKTDLEHQFFEIYGNYLDELNNMLILPEHFLNQTQLIDGITPETSHPSWEIFSKNPIGTGLMTLSDFKEGVETILSVNPEYWLLNQSVDKNNIDIANRFGDFSSDINRLRIRIIPNNDISLQEFYKGSIDLQKTSNDKLIANLNGPYVPISITYSSKPSSENYLLIFNLRKDRYYIGNTELCYNFPELGISQGLAIRKAIAYSIDPNEINNIIHTKKLSRNFYPISPHLEYWCNKEMPMYCQNYDYALSFMEIAGIALCCIVDEFPLGFPDWQYGCCDPCDIPSSTVSLNSYYLFNIFSILVIILLFNKIRKIRSWKK